MEITLAVLGDLGRYATEMVHVLNVRSQRDVGGIGSVIGGAQSASVARSMMPLVGIVISWRHVLDFANILDKADWCAEVPRTVRGR